MSDDMRSELYDIGNGIMMPGKSLYSVREWQNMLTDKQRDKIKSQADEIERLNEQIQFVTDNSKRAAQMLREHIEALGGSDGK